MYFVFYLHHLMSNKNVCLFFVMLCVSFLNL